MRINLYVLNIILVLGLFSCQNQSDSAADESSKGLFSKMDAETSGLYFLNEIKENEGLNILSYEYLYNGGGVAIGDINNDSLPDIFMVGNFFGGRLFLNQGNLKFRQISDSANVYFDGFSTGVTMVDINEDGYLDIYICRSLSSNSSKRRNLLLINNHDLTFSEQAQKYGLDDKGFSNQANFFDYDLDGDLDMFLINHRIDFQNALTLYDQKIQKEYFHNVPDSMVSYSRNKLFRNNGNGTFTEVGKKAGVDNYAFALSATVSDINLDGWPDVYVANDYADKDKWYINNCNGTFSDKLDTYISMTSKNSMGSDLADINNDGFLDLMTLDMMAEDNYRHKQLKGNSPYDMYHMALKMGNGHQVMRNTLHVNNGNGTFSEIAQLAGVSHTDWSWAPHFADFDNDGFKDLFVTNGYYRDVTDMDYVKYDAHEVTRKGGGPTKVKKMDLVNTLKSTPIPNYIFRNTGSLVFENKIKEWGMEMPAISNGAAVADLDRDGDLEIVTNNFNAPAFFLKNNSRELKPENNYISIALKGSRSNPTAIGAKVYLYTRAGMQYQEVQGNRGFLSYAEPILFFGLGKQAAVDSISIVWPDLSVQKFKDLSANTRYKFSFVSGAQPSKYFSSVNNAKPLLKKTDALSYMHKESSYIDFKTESLLEHKYSNKGPCMSKGDVNGDGREDLFIGGSAGHAGTLFIQQSNGSFVPSVPSVFKEDAKFEDGQSVFLDADQDKDLDLYVTSGSNEFSSTADYGDRLYLNDGKGNFTRGILPQIKQNNYCVKASDIDRDGDQDLFVGGHVQPAKFPLCEKSYFLINNHGTFARQEIGLREGYIGIVNDAVFQDVDQNGFPDLMVVGEWMDVTLLMNSKGTFIDKTEDFGLSQSSGLWNCVIAFDFDKDGDMDFVAGNRGSNTFFKPKDKLPALLYYSDFDQNGFIDAIPYYPFSDGKYYSKHTLDELFTRLPMIRKKYTRYDDFSKSDLDDMLSRLPQEDVKKLDCYTLHSSLIKNEGGRFVVQPLPDAAQYSFVMDLLAEDLDDDGKDDLLVIGNNYGVDVEAGICDASKGLVLMNTTRGFLPLTAIESGFSAIGETRKMCTLQADSKRLLVVTRNNNSTLSFIISRY